jgi:hypothetical protein
MTAKLLIVAAVVLQSGCDGDEARDPKGDRNAQPQTDGRQEAVMPESRHKSDAPPGP